MSVMHRRALKRTTFACELRKIQSNFPVVVVFGFAAASGREWDFV